MWERETRKRGSGRTRSQAARDLASTGSWAGRGSEKAGNGRRAICLRAVYEHTGYVFYSQKRRFRGLPYSSARGVVGLLSINEHLQNLGVLRGGFHGYEYLFEIEEKGENQSVDLFY